MYEKLMSSDKTKKNIK